MKYPDRYHHIPHTVISTGIVEVCPYFGYGWNVGADMSATGAWVTANRAYYIPILIERPVVIVSLGWENGATVSGVGEAGLYTWEGKRLITTGRQTQTPVSDIQQTNTPDTAVPPGCYFLAMVLDNSTGHIMKDSLLTTAQSARAEHQQIQDLGTGGVLPATATFANPTAAFSPYIFAALGSQL